MWWLRALILALPLALWGLPAQAENFLFYHSPHREGPWQGPRCDAPEVLNRIAARFDQTEAAYWHSGVRIAQIFSVREVGFADWDPPITARRYCSAAAYLSDGARHELVYWLRSEQGFAGRGWGVEYCLVGRDRMLAYAPYCRMLRPL